MSLDETSSQEEKLAALLATFDDALAAGVPLPSPSAPEEMLPRVEENLSCLHLLNQLRVSSTEETSAQFLDDEPAAEEKYKLLRLHAEGGIGQVWVAHDSDLDRDVALKELQAKRARSPAITARFLREARITGQLQHPGIVPVYELAVGAPGQDGRDGEESPFYTMRLVQGRTLSEAARAFHEKRTGGSGGALALASLLNAFVSVCNTVAYAHSRGVIHRDLKGQNIVLGDFGEAMVLDWGFAKLLGRAEEDGIQATEEAEEQTLAWHTLAGQVVGTPAYMAPEQAQGDPELIDFRTDVYGLGAILYEILTGQPPFLGDNTKELLQKVREETPARPDAVCPGVPRALAAICQRAMARDPSRRYLSPGDLSRDVQRWLADEPVTAFQESLLSRLHRWGRRHKPILAGLSVLLATGLGALVLGTILLQQEQSQTTQARALAGETLAQAAAEKAHDEYVARKALETQLYFHGIALAERELAANNLNRASQLLEACPENLRGWEWFLLDRLCHTDVLTLSGHSAAVSSIAFSPDGQRLASASHDHTVRLWEMPSGRSLRILTGHADVVYGLAYSPDGKMLATASWDRSVKVWNVADGREIRTIRGHDDGVLRVAFSPDGQSLASLSNSAVKVWDVATGEMKQALGGVGGFNRYGLAFSADGRQIAVTIHDSAVVIWEVDTGEKVRILRGHNSPVKNVAFSNDGRLVASGAGDLARNEPGEIKIWEAATGQEVFNLRGHTDPIFSVAFSPDSRRLVSASQDHTVKVWDSSTGRDVLTLRAHADTVRAAMFSPDGRRLATACEDGAIKIWDATPWGKERPAHEIHNLTGHGASVFSLAFLPNGQRLNTLSDNETIRTWDVATGHELEDQRRTLSPQIYSLASSPDGKLLATATTDGKLWLLDSKTNLSNRLLTGHPVGPIKYLAFSSDGRYLAMAHWDRTVWIWDVETGQALHTLQGHADAVVGVAFSPDGKRLASASYDKIVRIWEVASGKLVDTLIGHTSRVLSVAYDPDGQTLASASNDGTIRLWDVSTGKLRRTLNGHASGVSSVAFSPDGSRLASGSHDWTVKLWNPETGKEELTLRGHTDRVHHVAFSPDGQRLASASSDESVRIWDVLRENTEAE